MSKPQVASAEARPPRGRVSELSADFLEAPARKSGAKPVAAATRRPAVQPPPQQRQRPQLPQQCPQAGRPAAGGPRGGVAASDSVGKKRALDPFGDDEKPKRRTMQQLDSSSAPRAPGGKKGRMGQYK